MANKKISVYAIIISVYTAVSLLTINLSFGVIQIRISELLLVLCLYDRRFILPITLGCLLANAISIACGINPMILDFIIGSLATYVSGVCVYCFRNIKFKNMPLLSLFMPVLINGLFVGYELSIYFNMNLLLTMLYVAIGEFISVTILGLLTYKSIGKRITYFV